MLGSLSQRTRVAILGASAAALAFFVFGGLRGATRAGSGAPVDPERAAPRDSFLVATVRLAELRRSPLYDVLLGKDTAALGLGQVTRLADGCGFDPLTRVSDLAIAVPEEGDKGEVGVAARVDVTTDELEKCAGALADRRGGKVDTKDVGHFVVVEDARPGQVSAAPARIGYGHGGLLVAGRGAWFDAMLAAADGDKPSAMDAPGHAALRGALAELARKEGWGTGPGPGLNPNPHPPTIVVTALLPRSLRDRIKGEMGAEIDSKDASQALMAGVLGVASVGVAIRAGASGENVDAAAELVCDTEETCASVESLLLRKRHEWQSELTLRMVGLGQLIDSVRVSRDGRTVHVTARTSADGLTSALDRVLRFSQRRSPPASPAKGAGPTGLTPGGERSKRGKADETIPAKP